MNLAILILGSLSFILKAEVFTPLAKPIGISIVIFTILVICLEIYKDRKDKKNINNMKMVDADLEKKAVIEKFERLSIQFQWDETFAVNGPFYWQIALLEEFSEDQKKILKEAGKINYIINIKDEPNRNIGEISQ